MNNIPPSSPGSLEKWNHSHHKAKAANAEKLAYIRRRKQHADSVSRGRMYIRLAQKAALVGNKVRGATISLNQSSADAFFFVGGWERQIIKSKRQLFGENKPDFKPLFSQNIAFLQQLRPGGVASNEEK